MQIVLAWGAVASNGVFVALVEGAARGVPSASPRASLVSLFARQGSQDSASGEQQASLQIGRTQDKMPTSSQRPAPLGE